MLIQLPSGLAIGVDASGSGVPLLLIHGFPHHRKLWTSQLAALAEVAHCVAPDLRGFGESSCEPPYTVDQYADDLAGLLEALGVDQPVLAGLSMGGYILLAFLRRHPGVARALVLADTRAGPDSAEGRDKRNELIALVRSNGSRALADAQITGMLGKSTRARSPQLVNYVHEMLASAPPDGAIGALEAMRDRPDSFPTLSGIDVPTLILVGDEDVLTPPKEAEAMHAAIRGSQLQVISGAGHLSNLEQPLQFNASVRHFLENL